MLLFCCMSAEFSSIYCLKTKVCSCVLPFPNYRFPGNCKLSSLPVVRLKCDQYKKQMNVPIYSCPFSRILKKKNKARSNFIFQLVQLCTSVSFLFPPWGNLLSSAPPVRVGISKQRKCNKQHRPQKCTAFSKTYSSWWSSQGLICCLFCRWRCTF